MSTTIFHRNRVALWLTNVGRIYPSGMDFTKGFKTWHTEIRFMLIPIIILFIAHEFITGNF